MDKQEFQALDNSPDQPKHSVFRILPRSHGDFKKWLKFHVAARLKGSLPSLEEVRYAIDDDHDQE